MKILIILTLCLLGYNNYSQDFISKRFVDETMDEFVIKDFDGDGDQDVFGLDYPFSPDATIYLFLNESPFFTATKKYTLYSNYTCSGSPFSFDIDNDGDFDVILAKGSQKDIVAFINDGKAKFTETSLNIKGTDNFNVIDIDSDGDLDIIGTYEQSQKISLYQNNGNNAYSTKQISISSLKEIIHSYATGDIDNDGDVDLCIGYNTFSNEQIILLINKGQLSFDTLIIEKGEFDLLNKVDLYDINNDGKKDVIASNRKDGLVTWLNLGGNTFQRNLIVNYPGSSGFGFTEFCLADFNSDKRTDIIIADYENGTYRLNQISNNPLKFDFIKATSMTPSDKILSADFDGDKDEDLLISNGDLWYCENNIKQVSSKIKYLDHNISFKLIGNMILLNESENNSKYNILNLDGSVLRHGIINNNEVILPNLHTGIYVFQIEQKNMINFSKFYFWN